MKEIEEASNLKYKAKCEFCNNTGYINITDTIKIPCDNCENTKVFK